MKIHPGDRLLNAPSSCRKSSLRPHSAECLVPGNQCLTRPSFHPGLNPNRQETFFFASSPLNPRTPASDPTNISLPGRGKYSPQFTPKPSNFSHRSPLLLIGGNYSAAFAISSGNFSHSTLSKKSPPSPRLSNHPATAMRSDDHNCYRHRLGRKKSMFLNGHSSLAILVLPTFLGHFFEFESSGVIHQVRNQVIRLLTVTEHAKLRTNIPLSPKFYLRKTFCSERKSPPNQPATEMFQVTDNPIPFLICSRLQVERQPPERTQPELAGADSPLEVHHEGL